MIRTVITPDEENISIHVPQSYVGKKIEVLLFAEEELTEQVPSKSTYGSSGLTGSLGLTEEEYKEWQQYAKDIRNEWGTAI